MEIFIATYARKLRIKTKKNKNKKKTKEKQKFSDVISWVRCKVSFLCLKNSLMSIRGTRRIKSSSNDFVSDDFKFDMLKCRINN